MVGSTHIECPYCGGGSSSGLARRADGTGRANGKRWIVRISTPVRSVDESGHGDLLKGLLQVEVVCRGVVQWM
jgi:hypothetical protein